MLASIKAAALIQLDEDYSSRQEPGVEVQRLANAMSERIFSVCGASTCMYGIMSRCWSPGASTHARRLKFGLIAIPQTASLVQISRPHE